LGQARPGDALDGACQRSGATQSHGLPAAVDRRAITYEQLIDSGRDHQAA
jgi:hypothetical protein